MLKRLLPLVVLVSLSGCGDSYSPTPTGGSSTPTPSTPPPSAGVPFTMTDLELGTGAEAVNGRVLAVNYAGWLYEEGQPDNKGMLFDQGQGFRFVLGAGQVIAGWDQGIVGMREGGVRRLVIPPELAYGSQGAGGVIPPNATLVFDVELVAVG